MTPDTVLATLSEFTIHLQSSLGRSVHTARAYVSDARSFAAFLAAKYHTIEPGLGLAYVQWLRGERRNSAATCRRKLAALRIYFEWLVQRGQLPASPLQGIEIPIRVPRRLPRALTRTDVGQLLSPSLGRGAHERLDLPLRVLVSTGIRIGELCAIDVSDVASDGSAILVKGKGNRERTVFVTNQGLQEALIGHCRSRRDEGGRSALFLNMRKRRLSPQGFRLQLHKLRVRADIKIKVTPHCLRHTAATLLIENGVDIRFVQRLLGHASISTTEIYTKVADESLRSALKRADLLRGM